MHHHYCKKVRNVKLRDDGNLKVTKNPDNFIVNERLHDRRGRSIQIRFMNSRTVGNPVYGIITVSMNKTCMEIPLISHLGDSRGTWTSIRIPREFIKTTHLDYADFRNHLRSFLSFVLKNRVEWMRPIANNRPVISCM